jgi:insulysin
MLSPRIVVPLKIFFLALLMVLGACSGITSNGVTMAKDKLIKKSPNDARQYHAFTLDNGLEVMLISDPEASKGAAALDVNVGSGADPEDRQGLAHFLEHMLFLGTEKYPEPGEYQEFINRHGGNHNAFTAFEHTNYFFDIDAAYLEPALDRFSQQFVAPLFSEKYVEREKNAVHSEYTSKLRDDSRRFFAVVKKALNPEHPMSKFAVGNLDTLSDRPGSNIRNDLLRFYEEHYSAHRMKLVVAGKQSISQLESWVKEKFADIKRREIKETVHPSIFRQGQLPMLVSLRPIKEKRSLSLMFELPSVELYYHSKPLYYLTNLIGHEGEGSLLSWLKEQQFAEGLSAGLFTSDHDRSVVNISISLTEKGRQQYADVIRDTLTYIQLIIEGGIEQWRFTEQARMLTTSFRFQDKSPAIHYVSSIASRLHDHPPEEVLEAPYIMDKYDADLLTDFATRFNTDNMVAVLMAPDAEIGQTEPWYDVPYAIKSLSAEQINYLNSRNTAAHMEMPAPNQFIPDNLELLAAPSMEKPEVILKTSGYTAWYAKDVSFGSPKSSFYLSVRTPVANSSARNQVLTELYVSLAKDALAEYSYPAYLAGLDFRLYKHLRGITVRIDGFSDKQAVLLERILDTLKDLKIQPDRFKQNKRDLDRDLRNSLQNKPFERLATEARSWLLYPYWTERQQIVALAPITQQDLTEFIPQFWAATNLVTMSHGNVTAAQAMAASKVISTKLLVDTEVVEVPKSQVVKLSAAKWFRKTSSEHQDTAYLYYLQGTDNTYYSRAAFGLLAQIIGPAYYNAVRTEAQMGYVVFATPYSLLEVPALAFIVQSPSHTVEQIHNKTYQFLQSFVTRLHDMPAAEFSKHKEALVTRLTEPDKTLEQRSDRFWTEIDTQNEDFDTTARIADVVNSFTIAELANYMEQHFLSDPHSLLLASIPQGQPEPLLTSPGRDIGERATWLSNNSLFPATQP